MTEGQDTLSRARHQEHHTLAAFKRPASSDGDRGDHLDAHLRRVRVDRVDVFSGHPLEAKEPACVQVVDSRVSRDVAHRGAVLDQEPVSERKTATMSWSVLQTQLQRASGRSWPRR